MDPTPLTDTLSVSPQIDVADLARLAGQGFTTIIDNRPDAEVGPAQSSAQMAAAAAEAGLAFHYLPVIPGQLGPSLAQGFAQALDDAPGKVLAYCRSGTRSATLWALSQAGRMPADQIVSAAARAGFDLSGLSHHLR